jgi:hypothetical protein
VTAFEETLSAGGHKDATMHVGGHGEPWPEIKVITVTRGGQTYVCIRHGDDETVTPVTSVREGLQIFADELQAAIKELPDNSGDARDVLPKRAAEGVRSTRDGP